MFRLHQDALVEVQKELEVENPEKVIEEWLEDVKEFDIIAAVLLEQHRKTSEDAFQRSMVLYQIIKKSSEK
jgi:hypothetical protein